MKTKRIIPANGLNKMAQAALIEDNDSPDLENVQFDELGAVETVKGSYRYYSGTLIQGIGRYKTSTVDKTLLVDNGVLKSASGALNLLTFEQSTVEGTMLEFEGTMAYEQSEAKADENRFSLKCTISAVDQYVRTTRRTLAASTQYTAQLEIRGNVSDTLKLRTYDAATGSTIASSASALTFDDDDFTKVTLVFTTGSSTTLVDFGVVCTAFSGSNHVFYIDKLMIEAGGSASAWQPGDVWDTLTTLYSSLDTSADVSILQVGSIAIIANGVNRPLKYDGTNVSLFGIDEPDYITPISALNGSGSSLATGDYQYKITMVNDQDFESNPTAATTAVTVTGGAENIVLTNVPAGDEYGNYVGSSATVIYGTLYSAQTFTPKYSRTTTTILLYLAKTVSPGNFVLEIQSTDGDGKPDGSVLGTVTKAAADITTAAWYSFTLAVALTKDTVYALVAHQASDGGDGSNYYSWYWNGTSVYSGGSYSVSGDSGATWTITAGRDYRFRVQFSNPQRISKRKIYRSFAGGDYLLLTTIEDNTTLTYTDNGSITIGTATPPTDHDIPPSKLKYMTEHKNRVIGVDADELSRIYFSTVDSVGQQPEAWPTANWNDVPGFDDIKGLSVYAGRLMVLKEFNIHGYEGSNPESASAWSHVIYNDTGGCIGSKAFAGADNFLFYLSHDLTVRTLATTNLDSFLSVTRMSDKVKPIIAQFKSLSATAMTYWDNKLFLTNQIKGTTYSLIFDFITQTWSLRNHKEVASTTTIHQWHVRDDELYFGSTSCYRYGVQEYDYGTSGLAAYVTTKEFDMGITDREKLFYTVVIETDTYPVARNLAVYYALDGSSTWTTLTTSMSMLDTTSGRLSTRLSIRKPGRSIRIKLQSPASTAVEPWKVYSITFEYELGRRVA